MASLMSRMFFRTSHALPHDEVAFALTSYNRPSPSDPLLSKRTETLGRL